MTTSRAQRWTRRIRALGLLVAAAVFLNGLFAAHLLGRHYDRLVTALETHRLPFAENRVILEVARLPNGETGRAETGRLELVRDGRGFVLNVNALGRRGSVAGIDDTVSIWAEGKTKFDAQGDFPQVAAASREAAAALRELGGVRRHLVALYLRPLVTRWNANPDRRWRIAVAGGWAIVGADGWLREARLTEPGGRTTWAASLSRTNTAPATPPTAAERPRVSVPHEELDRSMAEAVRLLVLRLRPLSPPPDGFRREGAGWLRVRDGHRLMHLEGSAYDVGRQHGRLLGDSVRRLVNRTLYGVGLIYALEKGVWFPAEARALVERQRPYIAPAYFEEMRGLAEGTGIPLADIQAVNLFPEFFHCSGAALFGRATVGGALLHARVLDYMTDVGLQDEAVVVAVRRDGARAFVNVSYAGFIGSVTGMNADQVAIGEMGGGGQGQWDGTPMALLLRGALENAGTLDEAVAYMRDRKRTCEYYYVISDGKGPDAVGVAATPGKFALVRPGEPCDLLPEKVDDAVLLSGGSRYAKLVERVRAQYGRIDARTLFEIVKRPVAMRSNLHNVIFEPHARRLWVANAVRDAPACDQEPVVYTWAEMFP